MSTVKVTDIIRRVEDVLQDTNIRWPRTELQNWMNESYLAIFRLPGFDDLNLQWFLAGIVSFPKIANIFDGTLSIEGRYPDPLSRTNGKCNDAQTKETDF